MIANVAALASGASESSRGLILRAAWRNLWRNRRRTWLTAGGIAFAVLLIGFGMSVQTGSYRAMIETATSFFQGQAQISTAAFIDEEKLEATISEATTLLHRLDDVQGLAYAPRAQAFVLASVGERSFGGLVMGVDFAAEARVVNFFRRLSEGRLPGGGDEVLIGQAMARNLGASVGDELLMLGTAREGGVAALALTISGAFDSGIDELDRTVVFTSLPNLQNAFDLGDELHTIVLKFDDFGQLAARTSALQAALPGDLRVRSWRETMPELVQAIQLDRVSAQFMYGAILILVTFSVINTFIMVVFERTREFGMLLAIGMRPLLIMLQVQAEVFFLWLLGAAVGLGLLVLLVGYVASVGIPISGLEDIARQMYVFDRLYPSFSFMGLMSAPLILLVGTQLAVLVATSRVHRLRPVAALRVN